MAILAYGTASPNGKGTWATAKQSFTDLFCWKQRLISIDENGHAETEWRSPEKLRYPRTLLRQLSRRDWIRFIISLSVWIASAFDFHAVGIQTVKLSQYYNKSNTSMSTRITLTLLPRCFGAAVFGLAGDRFGRKWPMVVNMFILGVLQIGTIYSKTFTQFLAVRSLFGLFMGGIYGNVVSMALENCPVNTRGIMSGIIQQGFSTGYVFAACVNLVIGGETESWKRTFWVGAGLSIGVAAVQIFLPESRPYIKAKEGDEQISHPSTNFWHATKNMIVTEWRIFVYCIVLMALFNYYSHVSQDNYMTFVLMQKGLSDYDASRISIITKVGACVGGSAIGYLSQWLGRRRAIISAALISSILIPAWILPHSMAGLSVSGCLMHFFIQGAWGVIPIHLSELSHPVFRSSFVGITSQLGNMIASPSAQIVHAIVERRTITGPNDSEVPAYGPTMGVATGVIAVSIAIITAVGPENRGRLFEGEGLARTDIPLADIVKDPETGDTAQPSK